jgi:hypothetical protein
MAAAPFAHATKITFIPFDFTSKRLDAIWTPRRTLLLHPNRYVLLLRSANISIHYPVFERSQSH